MQSRSLSLIAFFALISGCVSGCGGGKPAGKPSAPVVEIAQGERAGPIELGADEEEDGDKRTGEADAIEPAGECIEKMREGRGLPMGAAGSVEAEQYGEALAREREGKLLEAKKGYLRIVQNHPQSPYVPLIYFAFGEVFFHEAESDPMKLAIAEQSYKEALKYPLPSNTAMLAIFFRLGDLYHKQGKGPESLHMLHKLATASVQYPDAPCARSLAEPGRIMLVTQYAESGRPNRAYAFFARSSGDEGDDKTNTLKMITKLCERYIIQQRPGDAAAALLSANAERFGAGFCAREERIIAKISSSLPVQQREELARAHIVRCTPH